MKSILISTFIFVIIDSIYLKLLKQAENIYYPMFSNIQGKPIKINYKVLPVIYILLGYTVNLHKSIKNSVITGLIIYSVYNLTNYAIFDEYTLRVLIQDSIWGGVVFGLTKYFSVKITN